MWIREWFLNLLNILVRGLNYFSKHCVNKVIQIITRVSHIFVSFFQVSFEMSLNKFRFETFIAKIENLNCRYKYSNNKYYTMDGQIYYVFFIIFWLNRIKNYFVMMICQIGLISRWAWSQLLSSASGPLCSLRGLSDRCNPFKKIKAVIISNLKLRFDINFIQLAWFLSPERLLSIASGNRVPSFSTLLELHA